MSRTAHKNLVGRPLVAFLAVVCALVLFAREAAAQVAGMPPELAHVGVKEQLDGQLPLDTAFVDQNGKPVTLGQYYDGKRPVVLTFAYHSCPVLCSMVLNNAVAGLKRIGWTMGKEYDVVTISIDPNESLEKTNAKRKSLIREYGASRGQEENADKGWHFLKGDEKSIAKVAAAAGFEYQYDEDQKQWGHPSVVMITTPSGKMARYLYGLEFSPSDLKLGLLEASEGRSITTIEQIILYCYHYDPKGGKYVLVARRVMQVAGAAVAIVLFSVLGVFWARELRRGKKRREDEDEKIPDAPASPERISIAPGE
ncbi:MAG: SCO family protein [Deltaproteobacteria bacterium]|nr:SCO family protein [Deltaproteobacteria bacterium]